MSSTELMTVLRVKKLSSTHNSMVYDFMNDNFYLFGSYKFVLLRMFYTRALHVHLVILVTTDFN